MITRICRLAALAALGLLAGCDAAPPATNEAEAITPEALKPGLYQLDWEVKTIRSTDKSTPATRLKVGDKGSANSCIAEGGEVDPAMFAAPGETCTALNPYVGSGRLSLTLRCSVAKGQVNGSVESTFKTDSETTGQVNEASSFSGGGDYMMMRDFTARRVGECSAAARKA